MSPRQSRVEAYNELPQTVKGKNTTDLSITQRRKRRTPMLSIKGLRKTYAGHIQALRGVDLKASAGMFGLLGPNGSGKTTLMKILATLLEPDSGEAQLNGVDILAQKDKARGMLGYLPQEFGFYPTFTAEQTLDYFAKLKGVVDKKDRKELIGELLERVNLSHARSQRVGGFSGGMRQRLGVAQAIISQPELLIVDEPTAGLDPEERLRFYNLLSETAQTHYPSRSSGCSDVPGKIVMLSTHIVADVSSLCNQMAVIQKGEILATAVPQQATRELIGAVWEATVPREKAAKLKSQCNVISSYMFDGQTRLRVISKGERPSEEFAQVAPTLEDYYFHLVAERSL